MVDFDCKAKMVHVQLQPQPNLPNHRSMPMLTTPQNPPRSISVPEFTPAHDSLSSAYESYLRLPELSQLWNTKEFPNWPNESLIKPALQGLEITFRFISVILTDSRPYINQTQWTHRLEGLVRDQVELISIFCSEDATHGVKRAPIIDSREYRFGLPTKSTQLSLLKKLSTWQRTEDVSSRISHFIESSMKRCGYTLGLGEPNFEFKPNLNYDAVCRPSDLHALTPLGNVANPENEVLLTTHQIFETWVHVARQMLVRIGERVESGEFARASDDCWVVERIWKLLEEVQGLHLLMDPDDFLRLKSQLKLKSNSEGENFCFRSKGLMEVAKMSRDLRHKVPQILAVEVDPMNGPMVLEAAMGLYREKRRFEKVHLLQAFQGVEYGVKRFFFGYKQVLIIMMGSLEANGNRWMRDEDMLGRIFMGPTYYPSLDGAKTFVGDFWENADRTTTVKNSQGKK